MNRARCRVRDVVFHPTRGPLGLSHDGVQQLFARNPRDVLYAAANLSGVTAKCSVGSGGIQGKHIHVAVMVGLRRIAHGAQKGLARIATVQRRRSFDQGHCFIGRTLLQAEISNGL